MIRAILWRSLRWRLLGAALLVVPLALLVAVMYEFREQSGATISGYLPWLDAAWFDVPGGSAIFLLAAVIVSALRSLTLPSQDVAYMLSLPVSRTRWILLHAGAAAGALGLLVAVTALIFLVGAARSPDTMPVVALLTRAALVWLASLVWIGPTLALQVVVRRAWVATLAMIGLMMWAPGSPFRLEIPPTAATGAPAKWEPWLIADAGTWGAWAPMESFAVAAAIGIGGLVLAIVMFERFEP